MTEFAQTRRGERRKGSVRSSKDRRAKPPAPGTSTRSGQERRRADRRSRDRRKG